MNIHRLFQSEREAGMRIYAKRRNISIAVILVVLLLTGLFDTQGIYGAESGGGQKLGLLVTGKTVKGSDGFQKNMIVLTEEELETLKDDRNPNAYGLGDSWVENQFFSSYDNHGEGGFHYSIVNGLDVKKVLQEVNGSDFSNLKTFSIYSADSYSTKLSFEQLEHMKYFAPGDTTGTVSPSPVIALYKTTIGAEDEFSGTVPETGTAEKLAAGEETFVYGQQHVRDDNNCHFIKMTNTLIAGDLVTLIKTNNDRYKTVRLHEILNWGIFEKDYTFQSEEGNVTHRLKGIPLKLMLEKMDLIKYMPDYADTEVRLISEDGTFKTIEKERVEECFVAWGYADDTVTPEKQTGEVAVYVPGTTQDESIVYNLNRINITDPEGNVLTAVPENPEPDKPTPTPEPSPAPVVTTPAAPASVKAVKHSYNSVKLTWSRVAGADGYRIYRYDSKTKNWKLVKKVGASTVSMTDRGLVTNKKYRYKVRSFKNVEGRERISAYSKETAAAPKLNKGKIRKLSKRGKGAVKIRWTRVSGSRGYQIYRAQKKSGKYKRVKTIRRGAQTSCINKKLKRGKTYYYKVRAYRIINGKKAYGSFSAVKKIRR